MSNVDKEIERLNEELSRLDQQYDALKKQLNLSDADIEQCAKDAEAGRLPKELQEAFVAAQEAAKKAGVERSSHGRQAVTKSAPRSGRQGAMRI